MKKKEPIRVGHIIGKWLGGGVESVVMNYYRHIDRSKIQFDFICDSDSTNIPYEEIEKLGGRVILVPPYQKVFKYIKELKKVFKENNYKIVHSHINTLSVFPLYAAKKAGVKVRIAHSHSTTNKKEKKKNLMKQVLRPLSKIYATDYFACSELAGRWLFGDKTYNKGEVFILNNAIDVEKFAYNEKIRKEKRKELKIKDSTLVIGHIGRFVAQKNHTFLIDIFNEVHKKNKDSILLLVGQGPLMDEIKEKVNDLNLTNYVKFLGQRNDVNELYQAFDVFVLPSLYEGLPVVGVEAQASGLLCLLSDDMTKETKILDSTKFMSLNESANKWASKLLKENSKFERKNKIEEFSKNGFNIRQEVKKIENKYINFNKKVIVHVVNSKIFSGLENVACDIIKEMSDDYNFFYVTQSGPIVEILKEMNIQFYIINRMSIFEIRKMLKNLEPNFIHAHDFKASCVCAMSTFKIPIVSHLHNNCPWLKKLHPYSFIYLLCSKNIKKILTVSNSIEEEYIFSKIIKNKITCIGNPVSTRKILNRVDFKNKKIKYDICCVARITEQKNPYKFIRIISKIKDLYPNIRCVWVGTGTLEDKIKKYCREKNVEKIIKFVGFQKNPYEFMNSSKIFMLTSDWEGFGLVAFEALTLGLPCIVSNVGGLKNIVNYECGYLCNNEDDFVNGIKELITKNDIYLAKSQNACKRALKLDNLNNYIEIIKNIYN